MENCMLCPRLCATDRHSSTGACGEKNVIRVSRIAPHFYEEPPISGKKGSGTVFFSGCSLGCVFCQNKDISRRGGLGKEISPDELYEKIHALADTGVHNINLVTPTHFLSALIPLLQRLKKEGFPLPIVYNTSGYERVESIKRLDGLVDIYLPDFKYYSPELAKKYSNAPDYPQVALCAIKEMLSQVGMIKYNNDTGLLEKGLIVRHLVLPSHRADSINVLRLLADELGQKNFLLSLMFQYTPEFALDTPYKNLHRRVTTFEYQAVSEEALRLGFEGFAQDKASAQSIYTPDFSSEI